MSECSAHEVFPCQTHLVWCVVMCCVVCYKVLQCDQLLQCVAVCCIVLRCVVVCCSVSECGAHDVLPCGTQTHLL